MSSSDGNKPPLEVSIDPLCPMDGIDENDDWVIVKKQRITIFIPPPSHAAANWDDRPKKGSGQTCLAKKNRGNCDAARKMHVKQMITKKAQEPLLEGMEVATISKKSQENVSESTSHKDALMIREEISSQSPIAPIVKTDQTKHADHAAIQGQFHDSIDITRNSFGNISKPELPVFSSQVTNKIMRARLLERRVAGFGGLRNWLFTCGLGWFVDILDSKKLGMYQIVSLTMNQLKDMGLVAVGPRRKLIHAIESVCQPNQFEIVS
ncbi:hypothetical protein ABZP36_025368 [Zizania latifolia]